MTKIKITDLPVDKKISKEEMKKVRGGWGFKSMISSIEINRLSARNESDKIKGHLYFTGSLAPFVPGGAAITGLK